MYSNSATHCPAFATLLGQLHTPLTDQLRAHGLDKPLLLSCTFEEEEGTEASRQELQTVARDLGAGSAEDAWAHDLGRLLAQARKTEKVQGRRLAAIDGLEPSSDLAAHAEEARNHDKKRDLRQLAALSLAALPIEWWGKRYKRTEALTSEKEREKAEAGERARWSGELAGILTETKLPYAATAAAKSTEPEHHRCCRGLAARTLEQRISCWRPFRRWLLDSSGGVAAGPRAFP